MPWQYFVSHNSLRSSGAVLRIFLNCYGASIGKNLLHARLKLCRLAHEFHARKLTADFKKELRLGSVYYR